MRSGCERAYCAQAHTVLQMGHIFLRNTLLGVFQYCAVMLGVTFVSMLAWVLGFYNAESFSFGSAYTYLAFMQSASQCYALYCLVLFYQVSGLRGPLARRVCVLPVHILGLEAETGCNPSAAQVRLHQIGGILHVLAGDVRPVQSPSFWHMTLATLLPQEILIACAVHVGFITNESLDEGYEKMPSNYWSTSEIANGLNDFMICVEMLGFAIAHVYASASVLTGTHFNPSNCR